jgi:hypothetical protein
MFRDARTPGGRELFACSLGAWHLLQEIGIAFGWKPTGTTYLSHGGPVESHALRDYEPGDTLDAKCVQHEDAVAWSAALQLANRQEESLARFPEKSKGDMSDSAAISEASLRTLIDEFTAYAFRGSFAFVLKEG